jgi:hypothetical protein
LSRIPVSLGVVADHRSVSAGSDAELTIEGAAHSVGASEAGARGNALQREVGIFQLATRRLDARGNVH